MTPNEEQIHTLYRAFQRRDGAAMATCYHADAEFQDPVFTLRGSQVGVMWRMLCEGAKDLEVTYRDPQVDGSRGSAHWEASYTFSATGRRVHNVVSAKFTFHEGKIRSHVDDFAFWRWSRMALGLSGVLLGWTPIIRSAVQKRAKANLARYTEKHPEIRSL
ncbi:MAG: nuclear transport factor 2 family protein [Myxococcaceae bacterium]